MEGGEGVSGGGDLNSMLAAFGALLHLIRLLLTNQAPINAVGNQLSSTLSTDRFDVHLEDLAVAPDPHVHTVTVTQI